MTFIVCKNFPRYKNKYFQLLCGESAIFVQLGESIGHRSNDFFSEKEFINLSFLKLFTLIIFHRKEKFIIGSWDSLKALILCLILNDISLLIEGQTELRSGFKALLKRKIIKRCNLVIATNYQSYSEISELAPGVDVEYLPSVGFPSKFTPLKKDKKIRFVFIGRLVEEKNIDKTIEFVKRFRQRCDSSDVLLDIYGEGKVWCDCDEQEKDEWVNYRGKIESSSLLLVLGTYDVLLLLSNYEPWGLVVDEALKAGVLPVISSFVGAKDLKTLSSDFQQIQIIEDLQSYNYVSLYKKILEFKVNNTLSCQLSEYYIRHENTIEQRLIDIGKTRFH